MDGATGRIVEVAPLVRCLLAPNPSPFTFTGTQTFIVGEGDVAVIDPGPDMLEHLDRLIAGLEGERVAAILCTHTHRDHSPASRALAAATGAPIVGCAALAMQDDGVQADEAFDPDYLPDRVLTHGECVAGEEWMLETVATPGHTSNHLCFAMAEAGILFTGDHVMGWSTSIVAPPDGDMGAYINSLERLLTRSDRIYYPAHGPAIEEPQRHVRALIDHRRKREEQVLAQLRVGEGRVERMVEALYGDIDPRLHGAAGLSLLAHLLDLEARGLVSRREESWSLA